MSCCFNFSPRPEVAERPATWKESLKLMGQGWGAIFIVILLIMLCVLILNAAFRPKKK